MSMSLFSFEPTHRDPLPNCYHYTSRIQNLSSPLPAASMRPQRFLFFPRLKESNTPKDPPHWQGFPVGTLVTCLAPSPAGPDQASGVPQAWPPSHLGTVPTPAHLGYRGMAQHWPYQHSFILPLALFPFPILFFFNFFIFFFSLQNIPSPPAPGAPFH